jgi:CRISPR-associated protein Cas1
MIAPKPAHQSETDYLPARMLNEVTYCPRLFYYEYVEGLFADNQFTVEGSIRHRVVDSKTDDLPPPEELAEAGQRGRVRSVTLSSDRHGVLAKMDLVELDGQLVTPVDYKRGRPRQTGDQIEAWEADQIQLGVQALILRENGYRCDEAVVYYAATKQRVRIQIDDDLVQRTLAAIDQARGIIAGGSIPPPLVDSPKCPGCSLVGICLPDETKLCAEASPGRVVQPTLFDVDPPRDAKVSDREIPDRPLRRLLASRDDHRPLYLNTQGLYVGKSGQVLKIKERDKLIQEVRLNEICQLNLFGNVQLTTQAIQSLCEADVPICYFSQGAWFYGVTQGLGVKNILLRCEQFRLADVPSFCLRLARALVAGKIRNQRTLLQRNHIEPPRRTLDLLRCFQKDAEQAESLPQLLGIEGNAARMYFESFAGMLKPGGHGDDGPLDQESDAPQATGDAIGRSEFSFDFRLRNRRPPRDPVNALLSLAYSLLAKDLTIVTQTVGFDPFLGFYHQPRFGRASLALDLMEPFRPLISDSAVLSAINLRMVTLDDFVRVNDAVSLTPEGRKKFFRAYEQRMDTLITHPEFGYRVTYRRVTEIQTRLLVRVLTGEVGTYPVFVTR